MLVFIITPLQQQLPSLPFGLIDILIDSQLYAFHRNFVSLLIEPFLNVSAELSVIDETIVEVFSSWMIEIL